MNLTPISNFKSEPISNFKSEMDAEKYRQKRDDPGLLGGGLFARAGPVPDRSHAQDISYCDDILERERTIRAVADDAMQRAVFDESGDGMPFVFAGVGGVFGIVRTGFRGDSEDREGLIGSSEGQAGGFCLVDVAHRCTDKAPAVLLDVGDENGPLKFLG